MLETAAILLSILMAHFLTQSIVRPLAAAVTLAQRVARGDLSADIEVSSRDEVGQLLTALRSMNSGLNSLIADIRGSIRNIAIASSEIAAVSVI